MAIARSCFGAADQQATQHGTADLFIDAIRDLYSHAPMPWQFESGGHAQTAPSFGTLNPPALGIAREHQERIQRMVQAWQEAEVAQRRLERMWSDTLREAATAYAARLGCTPSASLDADGMHGLYDGWIDCMEDAYSRMAHSESFCDSLAAFVNAGSRWRRELQDLIEHAAKILDLPTRSEINSLTQRLIALETELGRDRRAGNPRKPPAKRSIRARTRPS